jgi:zinc protease
VKELEAALYEELDRIQREPIAAWELEKAKNATRYGYFSAIRGAQSRAMLLGSFTIKFDDPNLINTQTSKIEAVTAADVQRVARQYLQEKNRTVLITMPALAATAGL